MAWTDDDREDNVFEPKPAPISPLKKKYKIKFRGASGLTIGVEEVEGEIQDTFLRVAEAIKVSGASFSTAECIDEGGYRCWSIALAEHARTKLR